MFKGGYSRVSMGVLPQDMAMPAWMSGTSPWFTRLTGARSGRFILSAALLGLLLLTIVASSDQPTKIVANLALGQSRAVYNSTLGFQKVFAIGFPERTDKRDALVLASSYSDIDITYAEGVAFEDIPEKAIPPTFEKWHITGNPIGCWRAHLNVLSTMVRERIETALILEDDADWDINVKAQMQLFAEGTTKLQSRHPPAVASPRGSPYGPSWDMLWLGHCYAGPHDDIEAVYLIKNDSTVPPLPFRNAYWDNAHVLPEVVRNDTRIIFRAGSGLCMWGYAMSYEGARKILSNVGLQGGDGRQIDVEFSNLVGSKYITSYGVYPPLFASHRFAGSRSRDSDIQNFPAEQTHPELTYDIVYSTIMNVPKLAAGEQEVLSQWPNDTAPLRRLDEKYTDQVSREYRVVDLLSMPDTDIQGVTTWGYLDVEGYENFVAAQDTQSQ